jgi:hypothetical protein
LWGLTAPLPRKTSRARQVLGLNGSVPQFATLACAFANFPPADPFRIRARPVRLAATPIATPSRRRLGELAHAARSSTGRPTFGLASSHLTRLRQAMSWRVITPATRPRSAFLQSRLRRAISWRGRPSPLTSPLAGSSRLRPRTLCSNRDSVAATAFRLTQIRGEWGRQAPQIKKGPPPWGRGAVGGWGETATPSRRMSWRRPSSSQGDCANLARTYLMISISCDPYCKVTDKMCILCAFSQSQRSTRGPAAQGG